MKSLSRVQLFATPWTLAYKAPLSMEFSRQEYWSGLPFLSPGDLPNPGIKPGSPALQTDTLLSEPPGKPQKFTFFYIAIFPKIRYLHSCKCIHSENPCISHIHLPNSKYHLIFLFYDPDKVMVVKNAWKFGLTPWPSLSFLSISLLGEDTQFFLIYVVVFLINLFFNEG